MCHAFFFRLGTRLYIFIAMKMISFNFRTDHQGGHILSANTYPVAISMSLLILELTIRVDIF